MTWLYFDLGSTLIDESLCDRQRILDTTDGSAYLAEEFDAKLREYAGRNENYYTCACRSFGLSTAPWRHDLERLYPGIPALLEHLSKRFSLGIIANQPSGLHEKLVALQIEKYFSVVVGSGDFGRKKPDLEIFQEALCLAKCLSENALMIGDRLDHDILPAQMVGMHTVWVRQGYGRFGNPLLLDAPPDYSIDSITELGALLL